MRVVIRFGNMQIGVSHEGSQNFENSKLSKTGGDVYPYGHCPQVDKNVYISSTGETLTNAPKLF